MGYKLVKHAGGYKGF